VAEEASDLEGARDLGIKTMLVLQSSDAASDARDPNMIPDWECSKISEVSLFL
jgi:FMN phosphatase YigB (HAD superfamily)